MGERDRASGGQAFVMARPPRYNTLAELEEASPLGSKEWMRLVYKRTGRRYTGPCARYVPDPGFAPPPSAASDVLGGALDDEGWRDFVQAVADVPPSIKWSVPRAATLLLVSIVALVLALTVLLPEHFRDTPSVTKFVGALLLAALALGLAVPEVVQLEQREEKWLNAIEEEFAPRFARLNVILAHEVHTVGVDEQISTVRWLELRQLFSPSASRRGSVVSRRGSLASPSRRGSTASPGTARRSSLPSQPRRPSSALAPGISPVSACSSQRGGSPARAAPSSFTPQPCAQPEATPPTCSQPGVSPPSVSPQSCSQPADTPPTCSQPLVSPPPAAAT